MRNKFNGKHYLSAAHGIVGIIYMLLSAVKCVKELQSENKLISAIRDTILEIARSILINDGIMSEIEGQDPISMHFCSGSPGAIPTLCLAAEYFIDD